ncbi:MULTISPECIES: iron chelate uptake ABC transporter family permease subunit [unclassified Frondihabitans]|uniref:FecCD family ABC transporter permease n=1 Tax=unclassified Frondihabitans TaxID=2626248 RepID=UPI000F9D2576|nr:MULTISPECIES: iron chelate uptake ABC transporter family permease subunit [unclassified Frondihabitans]RPE76289.1 iron complex transport system permease protein [Frondihabitans sp. PhB153]RPF05435.1 iron complex transport system permease protein [Frondihabitans sp. PhB161]
MSGFSRRRAVRIGGLSVVIRPRVIGVTGILALVALAIAALSVATGTYRLELSGVVDALTGGGTATARYLVVEQRLPRAVAALLVGCCLGVSGALFQSVSRNPLGSPDIIGFTTGAATGGLVVILLTPSPSALSIAGGTIVGGLACATVVTLFAAARRFSGDRLILGGIAVAALLASVNDYVISRAPLESAEAARAWKYGSLNLITWDRTVPLAACLLVASVVVVTIARPAGILELGDDLATGLGVRTRRQKLTMVAAGTILAAAAVSTAGPIGFLALAAPRLARAATGFSSVGLLPSGVMGAALLAASDLAAQRILGPFQIPVGLVCSALGGFYLLWMVGFAKTADA